MNRFAKYGPWALVTGAAAGLGAKFARQLAARGLDVVLVDVDGAGLERTAGEIRARHGRQAKTIVVDLTRAGFLEPVLALTQSVDLGLLINNAGISHTGLFTQRPLQDHLKALDLNARAPMMLAHALAPRLLARGRGGILFVSSLSALQGTAYVAHYAATKAYALILAEGLWRELQPQGVDVACCLFGVTRTPGFENSQARLRRGSGVHVMEAEPAVSDALDALGRGPRAVAGRLNRVISFVLSRWLPRSALIRLVSRSTIAMYAPRQPYRPT